MSVNVLKADVTKELHDSVKARAASESKSLKVWISEALNAKLNKPGASASDPLSKLSSNERKAAERYIAFLHECPPEFRRTAIELQRLIERLHRDLCRKQVKP
jgi:hypothetical protein